jgi:hypothetical protein
MLAIKALSRCELTNLMLTHKAKYLSQHDTTRHYLINYKQNGLFDIETFKNNNILGSGNGKYMLRDTPSGAVMDVKYEKIFDSPNHTSPMCVTNPFYKKLTDGYTIGPFYTYGLNQQSVWTPVLYPHIQKERSFKVLNFYDRSIF